LQALGCNQLTRFHMNEGHAALLTLELLRERREAGNRSENLPADLDAVRRQCVFTTHTPVPAGQDQFDLDLVDHVMGDRTACGIDDHVCHENRLNMTYLGLSLSRYINGVAKRHADVSRHVFAGYKIDAITNGVHAATWVSSSFSDLYDRHIPGWRQDNFSLRYALSIANNEMWEAHQDPERLRQISRNAGKMQLVFAGKAHPRDHDGKLLIQRIVQMGRLLSPDISVAYLPNYDAQLAGLMTAGVDVWLNTPQPPLEASGTSGMKAALNGVPSLSVLDGWWIEGCIEGITGWGIAGKGESDGDAGSLYKILESSVIPIYYDDRNRFIDIMRHAVALNGSFFNTQRMVQQYVLKAYFEQGFLADPPAE